MILQSRIALVAANATLLVLFLFTLAASSASAQVQTGTPKYESFGGGPFDSVNLGNLNVHFTMPILHKPGRGFPFDFDLNYDSTFWQPVLNQGQYYWEPGPPNGGPYPTDGWSGSAVGVGTLLYSYDISNTAICYYSGDPSHQAGNYPCWIYNNFDYVDGLATTHPFSGAAEWFYTINVDVPLQATSTDGSGYALTWDAENSNFSLFTTDGNSVVPSNSLLGPGSPASIVDRNGNYISEGSNGTFTDTLGTQVLSMSGGSPNPLVLTYTDPNGHAASATITWAPYTVQTNFGCSSPTIIDFPATSGYLKDRLTLPNGTYYQFHYEATAGHTGNVTGRLSSVTLPTGGTIYYTYTGGANGYNAIHCFEGSPLGLTRQTPDGTWTYARTFGVPYLSTTTITDPAANQSVIQFITLPTVGLTYEQERQVYQGSASSGTLLETVTTCYDGNTTNCVGANVGFPLTQRAITTQLSPGLSEHVYSYDGYGNPTETDDYDWGFSGAVGPLLKKTIYNYAPLDKIKSFASTIIVQDGSGNQIGKATSNYDEPSPGLVATSGVPQHSNPPGASRGNLTSVQRWLNTTGGLISNSTRYYDTGMPYTTTDPNHYGGTATTTYTYSTTFGSAYPTQITNALGQNTQKNYDINTGVLTWTKDPNDIANNRAGTTFTHDNMLRPIQTNFPDGGQTTMCYTDEGGTGCTLVGPPYNIVTTKKMTSSVNMVTTTVTDSQGRVTQTQINSDPEGVDYTDTTYDSLGRIYTVSNPHRSSSLPTDGNTTNKYDALSRTTEVDDPDGSKVFTAYSGNCTTVTDQASKVRKSCADGLGRIASLSEDPNGLNYLTSYTYDALDNLLSVTENSSRQRTFTYDSLSRLLTASNPESGATCYGTYSAGVCQANGYDANGNLLTKTAPAPNQTGSSTVTTTYTYDALNRLTRKTYSDGTTQAGFYYDGVPPWHSNGIGRLTGTSDGVNTGIDYFHDPMGRVIVTNDCVYPACQTGWWVQYTYDLLGNITSYTIPNTPNSGTSPTGPASFVTLNQTFDSASRVTKLTSNLADAQHPATLSTADPSVGYFPNGAIRKLTLGNGLTEAAGYNNRLQPCRMNVNSSGGYFTQCTDSVPSGNVLDLNYGFNSGTSDNGNVASLSATGQQIFNRTYGYDQLNRLSTLSQPSGNATGCTSVFGLSWNYDAWGNRTDQNVTAGTCNSFHASVGTNNRFSGSPYQYDAAGNLTNDGTHSYTYDAENRVTAVDGGSTASYHYDPSGHRVLKITGGTATSYVYNLSESVFFETQGTAWVTSYLYFAGGLKGQYKNSTTTFVHKDHLGSTRVLTGVGQTQIPNGGFESGLTGWSTTGTTGTVQLINNAANAHSGNYYVDLSAPSGSYAYLAASDIPVNPGDQITFGGWTYLESGGSTWQPGWWLGARDANHQAINWIAPAPPASSSWTYQSGTYTVPSGVAYVWLYATVYQNTSTTAIRVDDGFLDIARTSLTVVDSLDYLPFGEQILGDTGTTHKFTGYDRDAESGDDYAIARYYSSRLGRFLTPDPAGNSATCPLNPQTQNRYVYVTDNPVNRTDPTGLCDGPGDPTCDPGFGITLPFFPTGGGEQPPAAPTPHPVFGLSNLLQTLFSSNGPFGKNGPTMGADCRGNRACTQCVSDCKFDGVLGDAACLISIEDPPAFAACIAIATALETNCERRCVKENPPGGASLSFGF